MKISTCSYRPILSPCNLQRPNYQVDPYVGCEHYCYYCYALDQEETDWRKEVCIHEDITDQLDRELNGISPQEIYMGYYTDPYQPCETECFQTRKVLELYLKKGFTVSILTKSALVVRDIDVLQKLNDASVSVSVAFTDNRVRQRFEDRTIDTEERIGALGELRSAGIETNALICPVIPFITDVASLINMLASYTDSIWIYGFSVRERSDRNWRNVESILNRHYPDLKEKIEAVIFSKAHPYWVQLREGLLEIQRDRQLNLRIHL